MKKTFEINSYLYMVIGWLSLSLFLSGCKDFLTIDSGADRLLGSDVFDGEATANSAIAGLYQSYKGSFINGTGISIVCGLSSDDLLYISSTGDNFQNNSLQPSDLLPWSAFWQIINRSNTAIIELQNSKVLSESSKKQFIGEAKFWRAFSYFYLVNLFGDVPLILDPDVNKSAIAARQPVPQVYDQITSDLLDAESLLPLVNSFGTGQKIRVNKTASQALLARVYTFLGDWPNALKYSNLTITAMGYGIDAPASVFKKNSKETILQIANNATQNIGEADAFLGTPPQMAARPSLLNSFEVGDLRRQSWLKSITVNSSVFSVPIKYPSNSVNPPEYYTLLRLGEQYLIRAEAYAMQNKFVEAIADVNTLRSVHGGLNTPLSAPSNQNDAIDIILHERRVELFAEQGHRWFDLKRLSKVDAVISAEKPGKWQTTDALYPIPTADRLRNNNLKQNPGYD